MSHVSSYLFGTVFARDFSLLIKTGWLLDVYYVSSETKTGRQKCCSTTTATAAATNCDENFQELKRYFASTQIFSWPSSNFNYRASLRPSSAIFNLFLYRHISSSAGPCQVRTRRLMSSSKTFIHLNFNLPIS